MNRIEEKFKALKAAGKKAFVTFCMAGDPDAKTSLEALHALAKSADILEIGMPFTDPMADGPVIQAAGLRALKGGMSLKGVLSIVQQFRSSNKITPIVLMGYFNPILQYGIDKFVNDCSDLGVDGFIIVDVPPEEADEISPKVQQKNMSFIRLLTPTTDEARLSKILPNASGFLYYVSVAGVTGAGAADPAKVGAHIAAIKAKTDLPVVAGFGIKTPQDAAHMSKIADGIVVGSALVETIAGQTSPAGVAGALEVQASAIAAALPA